MSIAVLNERFILMPSKKFSTIWEAPPHTKAKIEMLRAYLVAWFQILGRKRLGEDLLYVDGFAGPGEYTNYPTGSPIAAMTAAKGAIERLGTSWIAGRIHCAFIEADASRFKHLHQKVEAFEKPAGLLTHEYCKTFTDGLAQLRVEVPRPFEVQHPLFAFIDPFGATGVPFTVIKELLASPCSEVLINLDADGIHRIFRAGEHASHEEHLNKIFDGDEWKGLLDPNDASETFYRKVLHLYKNQLRKIRNVRYVFSFEMRTSHSGLNYYLVFASQHHLGLEKMKEAMKSIDQAGEYCFSDAAVGQASLFKFNEPGQHSTALYEAFRGKTVSYPELRDFALNESPFTNPKKMLKDLECEKDLIEEVKSDNPRRPPGTFQEDKLVFVKFK